MTRRRSRCLWPTCDLFDGAASELCDAHDYRKRHSKDMDTPIQRMPRHRTLADRLTGYTWVTFLTGST